jgi:hypothetical protein
MYSVMLISSEGHPKLEAKKIGVTDLAELKHSGRAYYITVPRKLVETYELGIGDILKIEILEVHKKPREQESD